MRPTSAQVSANKLGVDRTTLYNWKNKLLGPEAPASMMSGYNGAVTLVKQWGKNSKFNLAKRPVWYFGERLVSGVRKCGLLEFV